MFVAISFSDSFPDHCHSDCAAPKNCIFREVLESLIEPLDENMEDDIRSGVPLTVELLSKILFCGGDEDASKDAELMKQMLVRDCYL